MDIKELNENIGKTVSVSDGKPQPPKRFNRKLATWRHTNFSGRLAEVKYYGDCGYQARIVTSESSYMVMNVWTKNLSGISLL